MIENVGKALNIPQVKLLSPINTLYWYGNLSSASVWYSLGHAESTRGVKKGEKVWMIGLGAGFEANSAVYRAIRDIKNVKR